MEYFKLKEFEHGRQEGLSDLPVKQALDPPMRDAFPVTGGKELLIPLDEWTPKWTGLATSPPVHCTELIPSPLLHVSMTSHSSSNLA